MNKMNLAGFSIAIVYIINNEQKIFAALKQSGSHIYFYIDFILLSTNQNSKVSKQI